MPPMKPSRDAPGQTKKKIIKKIMLQMSDLRKNNNKFYYIELWELVSPAKAMMGEPTHCVYTKYGRTGADYVEQYRIGFERACETEYDRLINNKTKKGYKEVKTTSTGPAEHVNIIIDNTKLPPPVAKLVGSMFQTSFDFATESLDCPLGQLTKSQVDEGKDILEQIGKRLKLKSVAKAPAKDDAFIDLNSAFYTAIPQPFHKGQNMMSALIVDDDEFARQEDLLETLADIKAVDVHDDRLISKYKALNADLWVPDPAERQRIIGYVMKTKSGRHGVNFKIKDVVGITRKEDGHRYDKKLASIHEQEVFHGTRSANIMGICSRGLLLPGQHSGSITGAMFGRGIYGAVDSTKSMQYCGQGFRGSGEEQYMFIVDLAMGKYHVERNGRGIHKPPAGYHSVWAKKGRHLVHDELIVYKVNQARLRYVVSFSSTWR